MGTMYVKCALTGGTEDALDSIPGSTLIGTDCALVLVPSTGIGYIYLCDISSGAAESSPDIIAPDTNAGDKRWILQNAYVEIAAGGGGLTGVLLDANKIMIANVTSGAITSIITPPLILLESGGYLLQEHGREIFLEEA